MSRKIEKRTITRRDIAVNPKVLERAPEYGKTRDNVKFDGWQNALTSLGILGKDKRLGATVEFNILPLSTIEALYQTDDIAARVIDRPAEEMWREGFDLKVPKVAEAKIKSFMDAWDTLGASEMMEWGEKLGCMYGGAAIFVGMNDGRKPDEPVDESNIKSIDYLTVLDRHELTSAGMIDRNIRSKNFAKPLFYRLATIDPRQAGEAIHYSRIIRFEGVSLPRRLSAYFDYWGDSRFNRIFNVLRAFQSGHDSAAAIMQDFTQMVLKMADLSEIIASGDDALLMRRLQLATQTSSILNALVIRNDEEIERRTTSVAGLSDLLKSINDRLVAATDMPHTILLGDSPSGLGATGESEKRDWYDHIKNIQKSRALPRIKRLLDLMMLCKGSIFGGKIPEYTVEFRPLWQQSEKDQAANRYMQAQTDEKYAQMQALSPIEIRESRFGSGKYSFETSLDDFADIATGEEDQPEVDQVENPSGKEAETAPKAQFVPNSSNGM